VLDTRPMTHVEQREFTLRLELRASFPEDYQGDRDGYEWMAEFPAIAAEIVSAAARVVAGHPGWSVRGGNRGRSSQDEITLVLERAS
jgi:hypothetical protein